MEAVSHICITILIIIMHVLYCTVAYFIFINKKKININKNK